MAGIFGNYDSISDMFDGGGPGASNLDSDGKVISYDNDNNPNNDVTGIASISNTLTGNSHANDGYGDDNSSGNTSNYVDSNPNQDPINKIQGEKNTLGVKDAAAFVLNPMSALPKVFGGIASWFNGLDAEADKNRPNTSAGVVDGRQVYVSEGGMQYSYNFLGMPYEVVVSEDGKTVTDKLAMKVNANGELDANGTMTGYQFNQQKAQSSGDSDSASQIAQYAEDNANEDGVISEDRLTAETIKDMAVAAGVISNQDDMKAILADPNKFLKDKGLVLADIMPSINADAEGTNLDPNNPNYDIGENEGFTATGTGDASTVDTSLADNPGASTYDASTTTLTDNEMMTAATGTVSDDALVDAEEYTIDMTGAATGVNADGTKNELGIAVNDWASVDLSKVIDTTTTAGKLLADKLRKEGKEFVDAKTSILWQMKTIAAEFKDSNGNPIIPPWAQAQHREVMKTISFSGISGTAATAAMSNAIMEATLGVAEKEATFFQTLTVENLSNKQEAIINKANILSNLEVANLDARSEAAVQNAKAFLEMDLKNLTNEQQAEMVNKQALVQAMLANTKEENTARRFNAEATNDMNKFYTEMVVTIQRHNTSEVNAFKKFNAGEINDAAQFNADMKNDRQQFLAEFQYMLDLANAKWRQTVETDGNKNMVDAHTADVKAGLDLTTEAQNNLWDSADNLLDYIWKTTDNESEKELRLLIAQIQAQGSQQSGGGFFDGMMKILGSVGGAYFGSEAGSAWLSKYLPTA
jgi:hypothetical protein